jgi:hypothetical protein
MVGLLFEALRALGLRCFLTDLPVDREVFDSQHAASHTERHFLAIQIHSHEDGRVYLFYECSGNCVTGYVVSATLHNCGLSLETRDLESPRKVRFFFEIKML